MWTVCMRFTLVFSLSYQTVKKGATAVLPTLLSLSTRLSLPFTCPSSWPCWCMCRSAWCCADEADAPLRHADTASIQSPEMDRDPARCAGKETNTFIQQGRIKLIKSDSQDIYNITKRFLFQINTVLLNFLVICESWKIKCISFHKNINVFNIDNNQKCLLSSKSAYYYDFWRSCDTEDWSNDAENTALITEINYSLTDIHI